MATQQFTKPRVTMPVGTSSFSGTMSGAPVKDFNVTADVSAVNLACSINATLEYSEDHGATWHGAGGDSVTLPAINDDGNSVASTGFGETFAAGVTPTNYRFTVNISGNPAPVGPTTITIN